MRILEIGCGAGRMSKYVCEIFGYVYEIDVSDEMIRRVHDALTLSRRRD